MTQPPDINIVDRTALAHVYPDQFADLRENWLAFIRDPGTDSTAYIGVLTEQAGILEESFVPPGDRADLVIAAFWAASADAVLTERGDRAISATEEMREAFEEVW